MRHRAPISEGKCDSVRAKVVKLAPERGWLPMRLPLGANSGQEGEAEMIPYCFQGAFNRVNLWALSSRNRGAPGWVLCG